MSYHDSLIYTIRRIVAKKRLDDMLWGLTKEEEAEELRDKLQEEADSDL